MKLNKMVFDDKKIEEAARGEADLYEQDLPMMSYDEDTEVDGQHHFCQEFGAELFKDGAKWAINEFLKNLWHIQMQKSQIRARAILLPLVLITMLIYNLKNPFFGMRNLGDIRLADAKSSNGLIYLIYCQSRKEVNNENICL